MIKNDKAPKGEISFDFDHRCHIVFDHSLNKGKKMNLNQCFNNES